MKFITGSRQRLSLPLLKWCPDPIVLVEPQELAVYREKHPTLDIYAHPKNNGGFSYLMNEMVRRTLDAGERYFAFTDDDVTALKERQSVIGKFQHVENVQETLDWLKRLTKLHGLAQLAVSFSGQSWAANKEMQMPVGAWGVHITDAEAVKKVGGFDEQLICFGDWDLSARLIQAGYRTARTNLVTFVHKMKSFEGGAADVYKKKEAVKEAAHRVASKFPGAATVKYVEAHGLHEVRFNWKKLR